MKPVQLILIAVALVAAGGAGFLMMTTSEPPAPIIVEGKPVPTVPLKKVLIASKEIPMGNALGKGNLAWVQWPADGIRESFLVQDDRPEALQEYEKTIARATFFAGEPIREAKIVRSDSGYLSAILPAGKRAVAIRISADTSAGGFILPNDHVDVIMSFKDQKDGWVTETILQNVRVLAIDQRIEEQDGEKAKVGNTATLELTAQQVEIISASGRISGNQLMLALRSVEDSELQPTEGASHLVSSGSRKSRGSVRIIRYGSTAEIRPKK